jgi:hypothetical protein
MYYLHEGDLAGQLCNKVQIYSKLLNVFERVPFVPDPWVGFVVAQLEYDDDRFWSKEMIRHCAYISQRVIFRTRV